MDIILYHGSREENEESGQEAELRKFFTATYSERFSESAEVTLKLTGQWHNWAEWTEVFKVIQTNASAGVDLLRK